MNLWKLELLRLRRTWRGPGLLVIFLLFGALGPMTARYLEQIIGFFGTEEVMVTFPAPTPADGMIQYLGNAQQVGLIAVIAAAAGALCFDASTEIAIFFRSRVRSIMRLVLTRYAVYAGAATGAWTAGALLAWYETWALIGALPADRVLLGTLLGGVYFCYVVAIVALAAGLMRGTLGVMVVTLSLVLIPQVMLGLIGSLSDWLPWTLSGAVGGLSQGTREPAEYLRAVVVTVLLAAAALVMAIRLLERREV